MSATAEQNPWAMSLVRWYRTHRRDLPWRPAVGSAEVAEAAEGVDPYAVLVSEFLLQQTQVATALPYFKRFMAAFPTVRKLARARRRSVLRAWQGLGYYRRAKYLHETAKRIVAEHRGVVPRDVEGLMGLPGIGRYTAGAVASIAYGVRAPILDGNVARVLCRLDHVRGDPRTAEVKDKLWKRAQEILPRRDVGDFNSGLMELGATICTPRSPRCGECPIRAWCVTEKRGDVERIPLTVKGKETPLVKRWVVGVRDGEKWLIEQRPEQGRWGGMWQFVTVEEGDERCGKMRKIGTIRHALSHRRYVFEVFLAMDGKPADGTWATFAEMERYPMSRPQVRAREMFRKF